MSRFVANRVRDASRGRRRVLASVAHGNRTVRTIGTGWTRAGGRPSRRRREDHETPAGPPPLYARAREAGSRPNVRPVKAVPSLLGDLPWSVATGRARPPVILDRVRPERMRRVMKGAGPRGIEWLAETIPRRATARDGASAWRSLFGADFCPRRTHERANECIFAFHAAASSIQALRVAHQRSGSSLRRSTVTPGAPGDASSRGSPHDPSAERVTSPAVRTYAASAGRCAASRSGLRREPAASRARGTQRLSHRRARSGGSREPRGVESPLRARCHERGRRDARPLPAGHRDTHR